MAAAAGIATSPKLRTSAGQHHHCRWTSPTDQQHQTALADRGLVPGGVVIEGSGRVTGRADREHGTVHCPRRAVPRFPKMTVPGAGFSWHPLGLERDQGEILPGLR